LGKLIPGKGAWAASDQEVLACYLVRATKGLPQIEREWIRLSAVFGAAFWLGISASMDRSTGRNTLEEGCSEADGYVFVVRST
jgi:hypothetical protein